MNNKNHLGFIILSVWFTHAQADEFTCANTPDPVAVKYGDTVNCSIETGSDVDVYAFAVEEGDTFSVTVSQDTNCIKDGFNPLLKASEPDGGNLGGSSADCPEGANIEFTANQSGIYSATLQDFHSSGAGGTGNYQIQFQCIAGSCISQALTKTEACLATFDGTTLEVPYLKVGAQSYWINLNLINENPIQLQLTDFGEK